MMSAPSLRIDSASDSADDPGVFAGAKVRLVLRRYEGAICCDSRSFPLSMAKGSFSGSEWDFETKISSRRDGSIEIAVSAKPESLVANVALGFEIEIVLWSIADYLVFPGVVYAGNRFECHPMSYPPIPQSPDTLGIDKGPFINDVVRLNDRAGASRIQVLAGAMAFPVVGWHSPATQTGFLVATEPFVHGRETGLSFKENEDRTQATLSVMSPGVRERTRYASCSTRAESHDRGASIGEGEDLKLRVTLVSFYCPDIPALFERLLIERTALTGLPATFHELPFSAAWDILVDKYNRDNWTASDHHYGVGQMNNRFEDFQTGWIGGLMNTLPLAHEGSPETFARAVQTLDFFFDRGGPGSSGFFHGCYHAGVWSGDGFDLDPWTPKARPNPERNHYHLLRKSADALYFLFKHYDLFVRREPGWKIPASWEVGTRGCADAFVRLWRKNGQVGQFVDINSGDILMGGTCSAGIAPAALALAARFFREPTYLKIAAEIASDFYEKFTQRGLTNGGPGEILQCPDSESAAGLLESYIVLWEETGEARWLNAAEQAAAQLASWQMSYDYAFPLASEFGKLGMRSTGSVFANTQNGHSAPGICTLSGNSYFKLWRATGKGTYLRILHDLAHNLTQYLSRADRPICTPEGRALPSGWMNERVNTSDWDNNLGGVFYGTTWAEVSLMLTIMEIPGVYVRRDTGFVHAFDHVQASLSEDGNSLTLFNPTAFPARVKILAEENAKPVLRANYLWQVPIATVEPGKRVLFALPPG